MEVHHGKHHKSYTDKLNDALKDHEFSSLPIEEVLRRIDEVPESKRQAVINNGGGYANHNLFINGFSKVSGGLSPSIGTHNLPKEIVICVTVTVVNYCLTL